MPFTRMRKEACEPCSIVPAVRCTSRAISAAARFAAERWRERETPKRDLPRLTPSKSLARRVLRILALTGAAATAVCVLINLAMGTAVWWSLFVAGGVACGILTVAIGIAYRRDIPQNIAWETALVILLAILWDAATGWLGWSLDFVFPCACATGLVMEIALWGILKTPVHVVAGPMGGLGLAGWCRGCWSWWGW